MTSSLIGRKLGKYEVTELLGQGGMATVYKAYQPDIDRFVAIKVLPPHPGQSNQFVERFRLEARTIAQLQHPHILPMHDYGTEGDILYLVMAFVDGGSLKDRIAAGPMSIEQVGIYLRQIASALDYAHRRGVIHRDIKPDNILIDTEGHVLLADFGVAKILEGDGGGLTATGNVLGTPAYMAPEQGQGLDISAQADIYSLGIIVYEMLTGRQPFSADTPMQVVLKHITEPVPNIAADGDNLPPGLEPVIRRVLAKHPEDRYDSAITFAQEFLRAVHHNTTALNLRQSAAATNATPPAPAAPTPTPMLTPTPPPQPAAPTPTDPTQTAAQSQSGISPLVLLGGFAIMAVMVVAVVFLLVRDDNTAPAVASQPTVTPTEEAPTAEPTSAATALAPTAQAVAAVSTLAPITGDSVGRLSYSSTRSMGDTATVEVVGLAPLADGQVYVLWLHNTESDAALNIGELSVDADGSGGLVYTDGGRRMLPALYNALLITRETSPGDTPGADVIYEGHTPMAVTAALNEIFVHSPQVIESRIADENLFDGVVTVAETALIHTSLDHSPHSVFWLHNRTEHTINVLRSTQVDYDGNGVAENPGFDIGMGDLLDAITERLNEATSAAAGNTNLQQSTQRLSFCINNVRRWKDELIDLQESWVERTDLTDDDTGLIQDEINKATSLIKGMIAGVDFNRDGIIDIFPGECGLAQIPDVGVAMGRIDLYASES